MASKPEDLTGRSFGRLVALKCVGRLGATENVSWVCQCECGIRPVVRAAHLKSGAIRSCGCLRSEVGKTHGMTGSPTYNTWMNMRKRCRDPNATGYDNYGGRGITVCDEWFDSFEAFVDDMGLRPEGKTLDRIDNDKGYYKANCRWATRQEQAENLSTNVWVDIGTEKVTISELARRVGVGLGTARYRFKKYGNDLSKLLAPPEEHDKLIEFDGLSLTCPEWARKLGINYTTLHNRLFSANWPLEKALAFPKGKYTKRHKEGA